MMEQFLNFISNKRLYVPYGVRLGLYNGHPQPEIVVGAFDLNREVEEKVKNGIVVLDTQEVANRKRIDLEIETMHHNLTIERVGCDDFAHPQQDAVAYQILTVDGIRFRKEIVVAFLADGVSLIQANPDVIAQDSLAVARHSVRCAVEHAVNAKIRNDKVDFSAMMRDLDIRIRDLPSGLSTLSGIILENVTDNVSGINDSKLSVVSFCAAEDNGFLDVKTKTQTGFLSKTSRLGKSGTDKSGNKTGVFIRGGNYNEYLADPNLFFVQDKLNQFKGSIAISTDGELTLEDPTYRDDYTRISITTKS